MFKTKTSSKKVNINNIQDFCILVLYFLFFLFVVVFIVLFFVFILHQQLKIIT